MPRSSTFYFGRFNVIAVYEDKRTLLLSGLRTDTIFESRNQKWGFFEIREESTEIGTFVTGYLVRFKHLEQTEVADLKSHSITSEAIENHIVAKSLFCLHITSGLIAFHPVPSQIPVHTFRNVFARIFEQSFQNFFVSAEIQSVEDRVEFFNMLKRFQLVNRVRVKLHPSNPRNAKLWERVDRRLRKRNATFSFEEIANDRPNESLVIEEDDELTAKFYMAEDGYGLAEVRGVIDGKQKEISTRNNPITTLVPSDELTATRALSDLIQTFVEVLGRFTG